MIPPPPGSTRSDTPFPSTTLFRSQLSLEQCLIGFGGIQLCFCLIDILFAGACERQPERLTRALGLCFAHARRRGGCFEILRADGTALRLVADPAQALQLTRGIHGFCFRRCQRRQGISEVHTSVLQSLMRNLYAGFWLQNNKSNN